MEDGKLNVTATELSEPSDRLQRARWTIPFILIAAATALAAYPWAGVRFQQLGAPQNNGVRPRIVGPGEAFVVSMPNSVDSCNGDWNGYPTVKHENPEEVGKSLDLVGLGSGKNWRNEILKPSGDNSVVPTVSFTMPDDPELVGKTIAINIKMMVSYPYQTGAANQFMTVSEFFNHTVRITVSSNSLIHELETIWSTATAVAFFGLLAIPLLSLLRSLSRRAGILPPEFEVLELVPQWR